MEGGGKYGDITERVLDELKASGVLLIVLGGVRGQGFSIAATEPVMHLIPDILRHVAEQIDDDLKATAKERR